jgi:hypothetical protein
VKAAPEIVSSARIEITANVFIPQSSVPIVAKNVRAWRIFWTNKGYYRGPRGGGLFDHLTRRRDQRRRPVPTSDSTRGLLLCKISAGRLFTTHSDGNGHQRLALPGGYR